MHALTRVAITALAACSHDSATPLDGSVVDASPDTTVDAGPCPAAMSLVDSYCIDQYEGALEELVDGQWLPASPYLTVGTRDG